MIAIESSISVPAEDSTRGVRSIWIMVIIRAAYDRALYLDDPTESMEHRRWARTAHQWLFDKNAAGNSLENVCAWLGIDPMKIRAWAKGLTKKDANKIEHSERRTGQELRAVRHVDIDELVCFIPRELVSHEGA